MSARCEIEPGGYCTYTPAWQTQIKRVPFTYENTNSTPNMCKLLPTQQRPLSARIGKKRLSCPNFPSRSTILHLTMHKFCLYLALLYFRFLDAEYLHVLEPVLVILKILWSFQHSHQRCVHSTNYLVQFQERPSLFRFSMLCLSAAGRHDLRLDLCLAKNTCNTKFKMSGLAREHMFHFCVVKCKNNNIIITPRQLTGLLQRRSQQKPGYMFV